MPAAGSFSASCFTQPQEDTIRLLQTQLWRGTDELWFTMMPWFTFFSIVHTAIRQPTPGFVSITVALLKCMKVHINTGEKHPFSSKEDDTPEGWLHPSYLQHMYKEQSHLHRTARRAVLRVRDHLHSWKWQQVLAARAVVSELKSGRQVITENLISFGTSDKHPTTTTSLVWEYR